MDIFSGIFLLYFILLISYFSISWPKSSYFVCREGLSKNLHVCGLKNSISCCFHLFILLDTSLNFFFVLFCFFLGCTCGIWRFPAYGSNRSYSCWPVPQPKQHQIRALSACTTADSNAGSLTH